MSQYEFRKVIALTWIDPKNYLKSYNKNRTNDEVNDNDIISTMSKLQKKNLIPSNLMTTWSI